MAVITSIKPQKNGKRVNIYLDDKFGFGLDLQTYLKEGLKVEQELSEKQVETVVKRGTFQSTYDKILRFATLRPRSEREFERWLIKHRAHESLKEELFNRLKHLEFLDDRKFANWWIEQRKEFKSKSKRELVQELRNKGVNKDLIEAVMGVQKIDERKSAEKLVSKKINRWKNLPSFEKRKKIFNYLMQKGFDSEIVRGILGDLDDEAN